MCFPLGMFRIFITSSNIDVSCCRGEPVHSVNSFCFNTECVKIIKSLINLSLSVTGGGQAKDVGRGEYSRNIGLKCPSLK